MSCVRALRTKLRRKASSKVTPKAFELTSAQLSILVHMWLYQIERMVKKGKRIVRIRLLTFDDSLSRQDLDCIDSSLTVLFNYRFREYHISSLTSPSTFSPLSISINSGSLISNQLSLCATHPKSPLSRPVSIMCLSCISTVPHRTDSRLLSSSRSSFRLSNPLSPLFVRCRPLPLPLLRSLESVSSVGKRLSRDVQRVQRVGRIGCFSVRLSIRNS